MPLNPQQMQTVSDWIKTRLGGVCPICKGQYFSYQDMVSLPVIFGGGRTSASPMLVIPVSCSGCSYTILLAEFHLNFQGNVP